MQIQKSQNKQSLCSWLSLDTNYCLSLSRVGFEGLYRNGRTNSNSLDSGMRILYVNKAVPGSLACHIEPIPRGQRGRAAGWVVVHPHTQCPHKLCERLDCSDAGCSDPCFIRHVKGCHPPPPHPTHPHPNSSSTLNFREGKSNNGKAACLGKEERPHIFMGRVVPFLDELRAEVQRGFGEKEPGEFKWKREY